MTNVRRLLTALATMMSVLATSPVAAQTVNRLAEWDQPNAAPSEAQSWAYTLKIDAAAPVLLTATCAAVASVTHCTAPIAASLLTPGTHTLTLTVTNVWGSATSAPLTGTPPAGPVTFKLTFTVSIP